MWETSQHRQKAQRGRQAWVPTFAELLAEHLQLERVEPAIREDVMDALDVLGHVVSEQPQVETSPYARLGTEQTRRVWVPTFLEWLEEHVDVGNIDPVELQEIKDLLVTIRDLTSRHPTERIQAYPYATEETEMDRTFWEPASSRSLQQDDVMGSDSSIKQKWKEYIQMFPDKTFDDSTESEMSTESQSVLPEQHVAQHESHVYHEQPIRVPTFSEWLAEHLQLERIDPVIRQDVMGALDTLGYFASQAPESPQLQTTPRASLEAGQIQQVWVPTFLEWLQEHVDLAHIDPLELQGIADLLVLLQDVSSRHQIAPQVEMDPYDQQEMFEQILQRLPQYPEWVKEFLESTHVHPALKQGVVELIRRARRT